MLSGVTDLSSLREISLSLTLAFVYYSRLCLSRSIFFDIPIIFWSSLFFTLSFSFSFSHCHFTSIFLSLAPSFVLSLSYSFCLLLFLSLNLLTLFSHSRDLSLSTSVSFYSITPSLFLTPTLIFTHFHFLHLSLPRSRSLFPPPHTHMRTHVLHLSSSFTFGKANHTPFLYSHPTFQHLLWEQPNMT